MAERKKMFVSGYGCTYCGANPGDPCVVTLAPEVGPLSITWYHNTRMETAAA